MVEFQEKPNTELGWHKNHYNFCIQQTKYCSYFWDFELVTSAGAGMSWILQKLDVYCPKGLLSTSGKGKIKGKGFSLPYCGMKGIYSVWGLHGNTKASSWCLSNNNCSKITKYCCTQIGFKSVFVGLFLEAAPKVSGCKTTVEQRLGCSELQCVLSRDEVIFK